VVVRSISRDGVKMQVPVAVDTENGDWLAESRGIDSTLLYSVLIASPGGSPLSMPS
jgi:hypothetical protein